ncbi:MAG: hypothetical protein AB7K09_16500 [Planctomycetota bacterium]
MPRKRRDHEEYLESKEPIGVVVLNDLAYVLEDLSEVILDLGKLLRDRHDEVMAVVAKAKSGPAGAAELLPPEVLQYVMVAGQELAAEGMKVKSQVANNGSIKSVDPGKVKPEMLEAIGKLIQKHAAGLEAAIATFEKRFLAENPPT